MDEPPAALPRSPPPLPQPPPPLHQPPPLQMVLADAPQCPAATPSTPSRRRQMAEPPPALPVLPETLPLLSAMAGPLTLLSSASLIASAHLAETPSPSKLFAKNPRVGDSGEVNHVAKAPLLQISRPNEEDGMDEDSTSLSAICARMIQSCTYTVEVKVCGTGGNSAFGWEIVEGTSTSMKDLLSCIAGTLFSFVLRGQNIS